MNKDRNEPTNSTKPTSRKRRFSANDLDVNNKTDASVKNQNEKFYFYRNNENTASNGKTPMRKLRSAPDDIKNMDSFPKPQSKSILNDKENATNSETAKIKNEKMNDFFKKQNNLMKNLKSALQKSIADNQKANCALEEKNRRIEEMQKSIANGDNELKKVKADLNSAKEDCMKTLKDFNIFKEKFCKLEIHYDSVTKMQNRQMQAVQSQLDEEKARENSRILELEKKLEDIKEQLNERNQAFVQINSNYAEIMGKYEKTRQEIEQVQKDFEIYRNQVIAEQKANEEKMQQELVQFRKDVTSKEQHQLEIIANMQKELMEKDEVIRQSKEEKATMEQEKNAKISELTYKINQIEKLFGQPTKSVIPMNVNTTAAITNTKKSSPKPSVNVDPTSKDIANSHRDSTETNSSEEKFLRLRAKKIPRPEKLSYTPVTGSVARDNAVNKKRGVQTLKNLPSPKSINNSGQASSVSDDDDDELVFPIWLPKMNNEGYVPETETDASESFVKSKRSKKVK
ncbi:early endosome antigen 1 isoform X1 [Stomoxys calcitrans]|uniref:early endosome antigen 1 isoform X1 n=1 Tax=Stomoxys calcitrans TaxID=35570 RepID=UPI0027E2DB05|nr:early endosome antigen 1 isoform X1 [Stomoxys calcitrans]